MDKKISLIAGIYFIIGLLFAIFFALYYRWEAVGFFSPGFYIVLITWPYQVIGFIKDFIIYGLAGKPI